MSLQTTTTRNASAHSFKQDMQTRHIVMLALGGVIGTGLFLTSGYTVNQAGPLGAVIAYVPVSYTHLTLPTIYSV